MKGILSLALLLLAGTVGCAETPVPLKYVTDAQASISAAEAVGAKDVPKAALHLKMARDQVSAAEKLQADEEMDQARFMLQRAKADADLAVALVREANARDKLAKTTKQLKLEAAMEDGGTRKQVRHDDEDDEDDED